jgi:hypothetical protein
MAPNESPKRPAPTAFESAFITSAARVRVSSGIIRLGIGRSVHPRRESRSPGALAAKVDPLVALRYE